MTTDDIELAREAFEQQRWSEAFTRLSDPNVSGSLGFADLERLAQAAHMLGRGLPASGRASSTHRSAEPAVA
jgi:hypothetical protein